jgi:flagellar hook protein FlgE
MFDILTNSKNAIKTFETALKASASNMGNVSTPGYKSIRPSFQSVFNQVVSAGSTGSVAGGGTNPIQLGSSVAMSSMKLDFSQGEIGVGQPLDLAISGSGLFMVSPDEGITFFYTRAGKFRKRADGALVTESGNMLYGHLAEGHGFDMTNIVPIKIDGSHDVLWDEMSSDGVLVSSSAGDVRPLFKVALVDFPNRSGLIQHDGTTFKQSRASGQMRLLVDLDRGEVVPGAIEKSNASMIAETVDAMEIQRAMTASLTAMKIANSQIQSVLDIVGNM